MREREKETVMWECESNIDWLFLSWGLNLQPFGLQKWYSNQLSPLPRAESSDFYLAGTLLGLLALMKPGATVETPTWPAPVGSLWLSASEKLRPSVSWPLKTGILPVATICVWKQILPPFTLRWLGYSWHLDYSLWELVTALQLVREPGVEDPAKLYSDSWTTENGK